MRSAPRHHRTDGKLLDAGRTSRHDPNAPKPSKFARTTRQALSQDELQRELGDALRRMQLDLDPTVCKRLLEYLALLAKWNAVYNLTAIRDLREMLVQHLFDCLAIIGPLRGQRLLAASSVVVDVGSGGGLPGVVIAIVEPRAQVHCVDTVSKKAAFIGQVRAELSLMNLHAHHARIEALQVPADLPPANLIVSRAFSSLEQFVSCSAHLLSPEGAWAAMKGRLPEDEIAALPAQAQLDTTITLQVPMLDASRHLLILRPCPKGDGSLNI